ncbi:MAG: transglutaminase-like domain-containing protein [Candidatus Cloacimonetes bacterium]|nr:transglutaminase-like domain-containing protein [Candidatus Cloacimonadota bacterium]
MKKCLTTLVLILAIGMLAALPTELTKKGNPKLYKQLYTLAKANVKSLPKAPKKEYSKLLKSKPDILMAYLLAYESSASLCIASPASVKSNYDAIAKLLDKEGLHYSPEFFLSYIAKQSVSDEPVTPYRQAMLDDGLMKVVNETNADLDRYRATALWCVSRLQFQQTSGRDQSPLDITQRSLIGRCEEMQILFVAAARTVGLPSRPASTPWWAHMDNNHAWAEVFLDGAWHYTGDMDAAWFPDQTWFSALIDKTVLILADGSLASENDEILVKGKYDTSINSTRNYAKDRSRLIKVHVADSLGKPISDASVIPMVFNWGSLRALTLLSTDKNGDLRFTAGRGAFYLSFYAKGQKALEFVPSGSEVSKEVKVVLKADEFYGGWAYMEYPANSMQWGNQPETYREEVQKEKQLWQDKVNIFTSEASSPNAYADSLTYEVAKACRGNNPAFWAFVNKLAKPLDSSFLEYLLLDDPKFLWQASAAQFEAMYNNWDWLHQNGISEEELLSLYSPSVFYEELPKPFTDSEGKAQFYPETIRYSEPNSREGVINILSKLKLKYKIDAQKALSGLLTFDIAYAQKYLTSVQYRILACSVLRANGLPTEFSRIPDLISVYVNDDWQYLNVRKLAWDDRSEDTEPQTYTLSLQINDENGVPIKVSEEQLNLCRYVDGMFYPLNNRFEYIGEGLHRGVFPVADAYLQFGFRASDSLTRFYYSPLNATANDSLYIKLSATAYPRKWGAAEEDILSLFDETTLNRESIILLGSYDQENCVRLADKLKETEKSFLWVGYYEAKGVANYVVNPAWQQMVRENNRNSLRSITLIKKDGKWEMFEGLWDKLP